MDIWGRKAEENIATSQHFHQSQVDLKLQNISFIPQNEQIDISRILKIILFPIPQKASKNTASHKGIDFNRDRVF